MSSAFADHPSAVPDTRCASILYRVTSLDVGCLESRLTGMNLELITCIHAKLAEVSAYGLNFKVFCMSTFADHPSAIPDTRCALILYRVTLLDVGYLKSRLQLQVFLFFILLLRFEDRPSQERGVT